MQELLLKMGGGRLRGGGGGGGGVFAGFYGTAICLRLRYDYKPEQNGIGNH